MAHPSSHPTPRRAVRRLAAAGALFAALGVAFAGAASAHVVITPDEAAPGSYATLAFQVPNESDTASTTKFEVQFPTDHPIASVRIEPVPGWTAEVTKAPLETPLADDDGEITEAVSTITWTGGSIDPGQFQRFPFSVGPLPDDADSLEFKAVQTYSDGEVSRWIDPPNADGSEPDKPAPVLTLTGDAEGGHGHDDEADATTTTVAGHDDETESAEGASEDDVDSANTLAIVGIVVGALGLIVAIVALTRKPKSPTPTPEV